jgi:heme-degrading monooxygenase HmoA
MGILLLRERRSIMYTRIRHYRVKDPEEATRRVKESFVPRIREIPGLIGYYLIRGDEGAWTSVSVFETREGVEESRRLSDQWNAEHLEGLIESAGETMIGETIIEEMREREREERRAA